MTDFNVRDYVKVRYNSKWYNGRIEGRGRIKDGFHGYLVAVEGLKIKVHILFSELHKLRKVNKLTKFEYINENPYS